MTTVNLHRKPARQFANDLESNENVQVQDFLENSSEGWDTLSLKLKSVADRVSDTDYGKSTSLGSSHGFLAPFREARGVYEALYSVADWCTSGPEGLRDLEKDPFETRIGRTDVSFSEKHYTSSGTKIIVVGDLHSSIHSFVEILDDLYERGIMSSEFELTPGYILVFLGDLVDRGPYGLDILHLVFRIKNANFQQVHVINGNHEDIGVYSRHGFGDELNGQISEPEDRYLVHDLLTYLPSVVFFRVGNEWIQTNHGGIQRGYDPKEFLRSSYDLEFHGYDEPGKLSHEGLRWNDFNGNTQGIVPSSRGGTVLEYGPEATESYLDENCISGILRGHQDFNHCAILQREFGSPRDMVLDPEIGMLFPPGDHWRHEKSGWEHIVIPDAFSDFSVFTTSTAVRARDLGYHTYLELTKTSDDVVHFRKEVEMDMEKYEEFFRNTGFPEELEFVVGSGPKKFRSNDSEKWNHIVGFMKREGNVFFAFLALVYCRGVQITTENLGRISGENLGRISGENLGRISGENLGPSLHS